jgi:hypothetical protein
MAKDAVTPQTTVKSMLASHRHLRILHSRLSPLGFKGVEIGKGCSAYRSSLSMNRRSLCVLYLPIFFQL